MITFLIFACTSLYSSEVVVDRILAVINNEIITLSDLKKDKESKIEELVNNTLILEYGKEKDLIPSSEEIEEFISQKIKDLNTNKKDFFKELQKANKTLESFKENLKVERTKSKIFETELRGKITISEQDLTRLFEEKTKENYLLKEYNIHHILLKDNKTAYEIKEKIIKGEDFKTLAMKYSEDKLTSKEGLGYIAFKDLIPEFKEAIKDLSIGGTSNPVKTSLGYHVIKLNDIRTKVNPVFSELRPYLENEIATKQVNDLFDELLSRLRNKYYVKVFK